MRGNSAGAGIVRTFKGGHFDHVAIIVRTDSDEAGDLTIIEAVSNHGVSSNHWLSIREEIGKDKFYEKVALRKLTAERTMEWLLTFDRFVEEVWHLNYGVASKLFSSNTRDSVALTDQSGRRFVEESRTFFCSELVAKAYKVLGVFDTTRHSACFFPKDFYLYPGSLPFASGHNLSPCYNVSLSFE